MLLTSAARPSSCAALPRCPRLQLPKLQEQLDVPSLRLALAQDKRSSTAVVAARFLSPPVLHTPGTLCWNNPRTVLRSPAARNTAAAVRSAAHTALHGHTDRKSTRLNSSH